MTDSTKAEAGPEISVVIPARDAAATIGRQLAALADQDIDRPYEVVVVDNGSRDATAAVARGFTDRLPALLVVAGPEEPNRSLARNVGATRARGTVLAFCDADDEVDPRWLATLCRDIEHRRVVTGAYVRRGGSDAGAPGPRRRPSFRGLPTLNSGGFAITRDLYWSVGGFREDVLHRVDTDLSCRLHLRGVTVQYEPDAVVNYYRRASLRAEMRQHHHWAIAAARLHKEYGAQIPFEYSWRNSLKHWALLAPRLLLGRPGDEGRRGAAMTLAALAGQLRGSVRYRTFFI